jgi:phage/conjugal plasmid C-4 type zinc finger TraR family protein
MNDLDKFEYNNEEEAEIAQIVALQSNTAAVDQVRRQLEAQRQQPSLEDCEECGEPIPQARRKAVPGVRFCVYCQERWERVKANYRQPGESTE